MVTMAVFLNSHQQTSGSHPSPHPQSHHRQRDAETNHSPSTLTENYWGLDKCAEKLISLLSTLSPMSLISSLSVASATFRIISPVLLKNPLTFWNILERLCESKSKLLIAEKYICVIMEKANVWKLTLVLFCQIYEKTWTPAWDRGGDHHREAEACQ